MERCRQTADKSGMTLHEIGLAMGYGEEKARQSAWQFLNKTNDPKLSMLERFAGAVGTTVEELVSEKKRK